jgi:hypothetical protein
MIRPLVYVFDPEHIPTLTGLLIKEKHMISLPGLMLIFLLLTAVSVLAIYLATRAPARVRLQGRIATLNQRLATAKQERAALEASGADAVTLDACSRNVWRLRKHRNALRRKLAQMMDERLER